MKQKLTVALILIAVAIPAAALAAPQTTYTGHLTGSPDSTVKLKESFGDLERAVKVFSVRDLEVECEGDVTAVVGRTKLVGSIPVDKDGDFERPQRQRQDGLQGAAATSAATRPAASSATRGGQGPERRRADVRQRQAVLGRAPLS